MIFRQLAESVSNTYTWVSSIGQEKMRNPRLGAGRTLVEFTAILAEHAQYLHQAPHRSKLAPVGAINTAIRVDLFRGVFFLFNVPAAPEFQKVSGHCVCHGAQDQAGRTKND